MTFKRGFSIALALSSVVSVGMILYAKKTVKDMIRFSESTDLHLEAS